MKRRFALLALVALAACHDKAKATADAGAKPAATADASAKRPPTTSAGIAVANLNGDIQVRLAKADRTPEQTAHLVELLLSRAQFLGKVADLEQADALAPAGSLARVHVDGALHRFDAALRELDALKDVSPERIAHARATILMARGDYDGALALEPKDPHDPQRIATDAVLAAKMLKTDESERLFDDARAKIKDVSPFPLAWIDFQRASLYELAGDDARAKTWFTEAVEVLSVYAHAEVHLAPTQAPADAISRLETIQKMSDDPEVLAALAAAHRRAGHADEATKLLADARAAYTALVAKHPEAFADHAARFWLGPGGDAKKALELARLNKDNRPTEEALDLWMAAAAGARKNDEVCQAASALLQLKYLSPRERTIATAAKCD